MNLLNYAADLARAEFEIADYQIRAEQDLWALRQLEDAEKYFDDEAVLLATGFYHNCERALQSRTAALKKLESVRAMLRARKERYTRPPGAWI